MALTVGAVVLTAVPAESFAAAPSIPTTPAGTDQASSPAAQKAAAATAPLNPAAVTAPAGVLTTITPGLKGFDQIGVVNATQMSCLSQKGYTYDMVNTNGRRRSRRTTTLPPQG